MFFVLGFHLDWDGHFSSFFDFLEAEVFPQQFVAGSIWLGVEAAREDKVSIADAAPHPHAILPGLLHEIKIATPHTHSQDVVGPLHILQRSTGRAARAPGWHSIPQLLPLIW